MNPFDYTTAADYAAFGASLELGWGGFSTFRIGVA